MDEINIRCCSFHLLKLSQTPDLEIYQLAKNKEEVIIISKDEDYRELVAWKGTPPKLISIQFGNCSNKIFWEKLKAKIYDAINKLIYGDLDIFDIK